MKDYKFEEETFESKDTEYSHYRIRNEDGDVVFEFQVPEPFDMLHPISTDAFLKYQHPARRAVYAIYKKLTEGKKFLSEHTWYDKQGLGEFYYKSFDETLGLYLSGTNIQVGMVRMNDKLLNEAIASVFIEFFPGERIKQDV